jgi:small subunit ribosomal protein S2
VDYVIPGNDDALRAIRLFTSKISESIAEGAQLMTDKQVADMTAATEQAQAREMQQAEDAAAALEVRAQEAAAAADLTDIGENISMEEVLGPGTLKKPVANEEADVPKVESQTV